MIFERAAQGAARFIGGARPEMSALDQRFVFIHYIS